MKILKGRYFINLLVYILLFIAFPGPEQLVCAATPIAVPQKSNMQQTNAAGTGSIPSYGKGSTEILLFSSYFCPACREMERKTRNKLLRLVKEGRCKIVFVDLPTGGNKAYAHAYATQYLKFTADGCTIDTAFDLRKALFDAAERKTSPDRIEEYLAGRGFRSGAASPPSLSLRIFNDPIKENKVNSTPTCVITQNGSKTKFTNMKDIINALEFL